jgi:hypothetical protein
MKVLGKIRTTVLAATLMAAAVPSLSTSAEAGWGWRGGGWGWGGFGVGLAAGALIGGALAAPYYGGYYGYGYPAYAYGYGYPYTATGSIGGTIATRIGTSDYAEWS